MPDTPRRAADIVCAAVSVLIDHLRQQHWKACAGGHQPQCDRTATALMAVLLALRRIAATHDAQVHPAHAVSRDCGTLRHSPILKYIHITCDEIRMEETSC